MTQQDKQEISKPSRETAGSLIKGIILVLALTLLFEVQWALLGTVVTANTSISSMQWAMIGIWVVPPLIAFPYFRIRRYSWRQSLAFGLLLGVAISSIMLLLLLTSFGSMP